MRYVILGCDKFRQLSYVQAILGALVSGEVRYVVLRLLGCDMLRLAEIGSDGVS